MSEIKAWMRNRFRSVGIFGIYQLLPDSHNIVLMYHSVGGKGYGNISQDQFREHVRWLSRNYDLVDLPEVLEDSDSKRVALTFDDGYRSFGNVVVPILEEFEVPATVFIVAKTLRDDTFTHDGPTNRRFYLSAEQLTDLASSGLVTLGNHTMTHPSLTDISSEDQLQEEICKAKNVIENQVRCQIDRFSYPYGNWNKDSREVVREEHDYAVVGCPLCSFITSTTDPCTIPRRDAAVLLSALQYDISDTATYLSKIT